MGTVLPTLLAGTASTTDTVHIVFGCEGEGVVDDDLDIGDVQATCCHVSGNQQWHLSALELFYCCSTLALADVSMDSNSLHRVP